jgi:PRC-barrel domain
VPVELVDSVTSGVRLACTIVQFDALEQADEGRFVPGASGRWTYQQDQMVSFPYFGLESGIGMGRAFSDPGEPTYERVPKDDVEVRRGEQVHATDGTIGRVRGLVVDPGDDKVTHVLLDEGHLWGEKRVAIPIGAVSDVAHGVRLTLTKDEVRDLPDVELASPE